MIRFAVMLMTCIAIVSPALAECPQDGQNCPKNMPKEMGKMTPEMQKKMQERMQEKFGKMDGDKNGQVSEAEFLAKSKEHFGKMDADQNGQVTLDEFRSGMRKQHAERMDKKMERVKDMKDSSKHDTHQPQGE